MGEVFAGRYELVDPVGRGGVGAVWRAWDHRRRRYVAAKVLQQSDAHTLLRFVREQALRIDHPHVLAPASWAADDDKVLFTMDLVAGGSLAHVIGDYGALPPRYVCTLLDQLLSGLAAVHAEGVVHRDIKPANILLDVTGTGRPHLRLSDFGISMRKGEPRLTETDYVVGTPGYFAPEQLRGAEPDFPADLFAVGLVALYLLQGRKPDSQALVEYFLAHGTPGAPQGIPEPLWQVLAGLLQPDPQARFRTATGARKALNAAVELLPEPAPGEEPGQAAGAAEAAEVVEIFDQIGPLPPGFGPNGPERTPPAVQQPPAAVQQPPAAVQQPPAAVQQPPAAVQQPPAVQPPQAVQPPRQAEPAPEVQQSLPPHLPGPSETGSFHLPPPPQVPEAPQTPQRPAGPPTQPATVPPPAAHGMVRTPVNAPVHAPAHAPLPTSTPAPAPAPAQPPAHAAPGAPGALPLSTPPPRSPASFAQAPTSTVPYEPGPAQAVVVPARRPGPPAKVAVPVLFAALVCFAVGIWALIQA
ncbi:protein kinase [Streptomyces sp. NPDC020422]|uniref:serine/threonine-protein kinase n=1 Tax=Streptomyces sp. NPDC020422 TaxID=3365074 RepID=UPI0037BB703F